MPFSVQVDFALQPNCPLFWMFAASSVLHYLTTNMDTFSKLMHVLTKLI